MTDPERDLSVERWLRQTPAAGVRSESACLDAETLAAWAEGLLRGPQRSSAEAHASGCARCQAMLAVMVRTMPGPPPTRSASPLRKWLMMLSPALAAGAAVALWFAVDQKPLQPPSASLSQDLRVPGQVAESAGAAAPLPSGALEKDVSGRAPGRSFDREMPKRDAPTSDLQASKALADAVKEREERGSTADTKVSNALLGRARIPNERKDESPATRIAGSAPPPPSPAPPRPAAESFQASAGDRSAPARSTPPAAPVQQADQSQSQSQSPNQPAPRRQVAEPMVDRGAAAERPVDVSVSSSVAGRDAAKRNAAAAGGAGGAIAFRTNVATFDVVPPRASARWRVAEGRTVQRSLDAGATWADQHRAEDGVVLTAGAAPTPTVCWLVGRGGAIVLTTDGRDWRRVKFPEPVDLTAVTSTDARTATVTTANGRQFLTTDGGRNWTPR